MSGAASAVFCCGFFLSLLCVLAVAARIVFTRKAKIIGLADYLMTLGTGCFIVSNIIICPVLFSGFGRQDWVLDLAEPPKGAKWIVFWGLFFTISTVPIKASVCLSLLRYAQYRVYRTVVYGLIGLVIFAAVTLFVTILRACQPVSYLWNPGNQTGACDHIGLTIASIYIFAAISIFIDLCITMLPPLLFWNVQMTQEQKSVVCLLLAVGLVATGATMARAFYVPTYLETEGWQSTFYVQLAGTVITSQLEVGFAILGGCVDNFKQFKHWKARRNAAGSVTRPTPWPVNPPTTTTTISGGLTRKEKRALKKSQRRLEESSSVPMDDLGIFVQTGIERSVSSNPENRNANPSDAIRSSATVVPGAPLIPANSVPRLSLNLQGSPVSAARVDSSERSGGPDHMPSISIEEEV